MAKRDPRAADHLEWIGFVRPTGLVVSASALVSAGVILNGRDAEGQRLLRECLVDGTADVGSSVAAAPSTVAEPTLRDFRTVAATLLGWTFSPKGYAGTEEIPIPAELEVRLPDSGGVIRPDFAVRMEPVKSLATTYGAGVPPADSPSVDSTNQVRDVEIVQSKSDSDQASAWQLLAMACETSQPFDRAEDRSRHRAGGDLSPHSRMERLLRETGVPAGLLYNGEALRPISAPKGESSGWLDFRVADMLPQDETFLGGYSLANLYERLRADAALHPDTMDQRYGAYAQILVLSRMVHDGAGCGAMSLPPRHGALFDPDRYRFLEGRGSQVAGARQVNERIEPPLVSDGTVWRVLEKLILLDGERISYRALDVEHVGSVYETMMGFRLETATGRSVAIKAAKKHGAPATVDIEALLAEQPAKRAKWIQDRTDRKLTPKVSRAVRSADSIEALLAALDSVIDKAATPDVVPKGAIILQPSEERRRSGSHYTPRELTEPIVRKTLEPILHRLRGTAGRVPKPKQILDLYVCDPAMGSGAFLVEACRQLGAALVEAWHAYDAVPEIPSDENEIIFARRLIAQRCLCGLDRNPTAVDLAKLSLWLVTLAVVSQIIRSARPTLAIGMSSTSTTGHCAARNWG